MRAARKGDAELARMLSEGGADPGLAMANGGTALMFAAGLGGAGRFTSYEARQAAAERGEAMARFLVEHGARIDLADGNGITPLDVAEGRGRPGRRSSGPRPEVAAVLRALAGAGAPQN